jgi:hypothetical protein
MGFDKIFDFISFICHCYFPGCSPRPAPPLPYPAVHIKSDTLNQATIAAAILKRNHSLVKYTNKYLNGFLQLVDIRWFMRHGSEARVSFEFFI